MRFNRLWLLLLIGVLFYASNAYAGCCGYVSGSFIGTCQPATLPECTGNNFYSPSNCPVAPQCDTGCCCINVNGGWTGNGDYINYACDFFNGSFYPQILASECQNFCVNGQNVPNYTLYGNVFTPSGVSRTGIFINLTNRQDRTFNTTDPLGYYIFSSVRSGDVQISAKKDQCSYTGMVTLNTNRNFNFTLTCCEYNCVTGLCINGQQTTNCTAINASICSEPSYTYNTSCAVNLCPWNCTAWTPPGEPGDPCPPTYTQRTRTCTQINNGSCVMGGTEPDRTAACTSTTISCGNGIIEGLEQCDFNQTNGQGSSLCNAPYNTYEWCTGDCECEYPNIDECMQNPQYPTTVGLAPVYKKRQINASWGDPNRPCADYVESYKLWICNNASGGCNNINSGYTSIPPVMPKNVFNRLYTGDVIPLFHNTQYCFFLTTTFNQSVNGNKVRNSSISCMTMGDEDCIKEPPMPEKWCGLWPQVGGEPAVLSCTPENFVNGQTCTALGYPGGYCTMVGESFDCVMPSQCDRCNGLFGIFGYQNFEINVDNNGPDTLICPGPSPTNIDQIRAFYGSGGFAGCYLDYSNTSVDKTYNCTMTTSCYDYKSRKTCESDPCETFDYNGEELCEWADYSAVFNKGVCRPKTEYVQQGIVEQNCALCHNESYNRMYGGCTVDTCGLYGYCYYQQNTERCLDGFDLSCANYTNAQDCTGGTGVDVDVNWAFSGGKWSKVSGSNIVLANSSDLLGVKKCEWNGTKCFRNADNLSNTIGPAGRDCVFSDASKKMICEKDIIPSNITITPKPHYGTIIDLSNRIAVYDNENWVLGDNTTESSAQRDNIWVYYCVENSWCYPNKVLQVTGDSAYKISVPDGISSQEGDVAYVYYFTEDPGRNLGAINNFDFTVDAVSPQIIFSYDMDTYRDPVNASLWLTNLFARVRLLSETSFPVICNFNMTPTINPTMIQDWENYMVYDIPSPYPPQNNILNNAPGELNTTYLALQNDFYNYIVSCIDDAGNEYHNNGTIRIEGDLTISGPSPANEKFTSSTLPPQVSINTTADGICRYSQYTTDYNAMTNTYHKTPISANQFVHYATINEVFPELEENGLVESKIYKIYTACNLSINGQYKIIVGEYSDIIRFSVDDLPPLTRMEYVPDPDNYPNEWTNFTNNQTINLLHLRLINDDDDPRLIDSNGTGGNMAFGPKETFFCITRRELDCAPGMYESYNFTSQPKIILDYTTQNTTHYVEYGIYPKFCRYSIDGGNNPEQERCIILRLSNTDFSAPNITIIPT